MADFVASLKPSPGQRGAAFAIDGRLCDLDLFDHSATLAGLLPKLVRSYALDALEVAAETPERMASVEEAAAFLREAAAARCEAFPAVGEGEDVRFECSSLCGGALQARGRIVHLCAFRSSDANAKRNPSMGGAGRMVTMRARRRARSGG